MTDLRDSDVVIVGGGPAGIMAGLLLARAGVRVNVLEKHGDFLRDFRGDTVHPSTMEILSELGLLERFLQRPHNRVDTAQVRIAGRNYTIGISRTSIARPRSLPLCRSGISSISCEGKRRNSRDSRLK